jgi:hypothetical protein
MNELTDAVARILFAKFGLSGNDSAGNSTFGNYMVTTGADGQARVAHTFSFDMFDPDRPSSEVVRVERHRLIDEYAEALTAAGWVVEKRHPHSFNPYLLASRPA